MNELPSHGQSDFYNFLDECTRPDSNKGRFDKKLKIANQKLSTLKKTVQYQVIHNEKVSEILHGDAEISPVGIELLHQMAGPTALTEINAILNMQGPYSEYVDLIKVLYRLAVCIKPENYPYLSVFIPEPSDKISLSAGRRFWTQAQHHIDLAEQVSKAAMLLRSSLQDFTHDKPQFLRFDFAKRSASRDSRAELEGEQWLSLASQRCEKDIVLL